MPTCFVIQPFDSGAFDKRYEEVFAPAIKAAGIEPYRVDRDDHAVIPIHSIEQGIRRADVCLADISQDNPNVWFEVGYAIASGKDPVLVCSQDRPRFPFDIQHRTIIRYKTESLTDFSTLTDAITRRLKAALTKKAELATIDALSPIANAEGLTPHEMVALVVIASSYDGPIAAYRVASEMNDLGHNQLAASLALRSLTTKQYVKPGKDSDYNGNEFLAYEATDAGFRWLEANQNRLTLRNPPKKTKAVDSTQDIPF